MVRLAAEIATRAAAPRELERVLGATADRRYVETSLPLGPPMKQSWLALVGFVLGATLATSGCDDDTPGTQGKGGGGGSAQGSAGNLVMGSAGSPRQGAGGVSGGGAGSGSGAGGNDGGNGGGGSGAAGVNGAGGGAGSAGSAGAGGDGNGSGGGGAGGESGFGGAGSGGNGGLNCKAPAVECAGACVDVASDAAHCGECDYACGAGSACTQGVCAPQTVVAGVVAPFAFALDATSLYFGSAVTDGIGVPQPAVRKVPREGGPPSSVFGTTLFRSRTLALAGDTLFFGDLDNGGVLRKGPIVDGDPNTHVANQAALLHLVAADGRLWWASFDGNSNLHRAASSDSTPVEVLAFQTGRVDSLAVEGTGNGAVVYWVNRDTSPGAKSGLWRRAEGVAEVQLVPGGQMRQLALGADGVYVVDMLTGIGKVAKNVAQAALNPIISPADVGGTAQGLALANGQLYWLAVSAEGQLELHRSDLDGTGRRVLGRIAAKQPSYWDAPIGASQITVDGGFVYFADPGTITGDTQGAANLQGVKGAADGAIYRLPQYGGSGGAGGNGPGCTLPTVDCDGTCVDVKAGDAANCGACGHSCFGTATCAEGACVPEAMATNEVAPYALVDDGTSLYWVSPAAPTGGVNNARMRRVAKATPGGAAVNVLDGTRVRARSFAFDGAKFYWGDLASSPTDQNQNVVSAASGDLGPAFVEKSQLNVQHVIVAGGSIYWTAGTDAAVRSKQIGSTTLTLNISLQTNPGWLAVDTDALPYWVAGTPSEARRAKASPPNTHEPVATGASIVAVELTQDRFYWADRQGQTVQSRPKATPNGAPRDEFSGLGTIEGFHLDGATLYVLTAQGQALRVFRKGPGDTAPFLLGEVTAKDIHYLGNPFGGAYLLIDAQYIYFADAGTVDTNQIVPISQGDGVVYRVAK
jgi:hypothetical protein